VGRLPLLLSVVAAGKPAVVVTVKVRFWPTVNVSLAALVKVGGVTTVNLSTWVTGGVTPSLAVTVTTYWPIARPGAPARVAVPSPLSWKVTPAGSRPVSLSAGVRPEEVVTVNALARPAAKLVAPGLVNDGGSAPVTTTVFVLAPGRPLLEANSEYEPAR